jgi:hypothetical protein
MNCTLQETESNVAVRKDPVLLTKFMRIWHGSCSKKKAIVAVARMLIVRLMACMVSGTLYTTGLHDREEI